VVRRARSFVGATIPGELDFVQANFASDLRLGPPQRFAEQYRAAAA